MGRGVWEHRRGLGGANGDEYNQYTFCTCGPNTKEIFFLCSITLEKMPQGISGISKTHPGLRFWWKESPVVYRSHSEPPSKSFPCFFFPPCLAVWALGGCCSQLQGEPATAEIRPRNYIVPFDSGFAWMQNAWVMGSQRFPMKFWKRLWVLWRPLAESESPRSL